MELKIRKDMLADKIRKAVYAPRVCVRFEAIQKCLIGGNAIAQTDAGGGKELGGAADDKQIIKLLHQRDGADFGQDIGKFDIGFINHDGGTDFFAVRQNLTHFLCADGSACGVIGVAGNEHPDIGGEGFQERRQVQLEIFLLLQGEILKFAAAQRNLSFIFGIGRPHDDGMLCMHRLDEGGNQLRRAIAYDDVGGVCAGIGADCLLECLIFFIGIGADEVQIFLQRVLCPFGKAKGVDIAAEINDFFLGDAVGSLDGIQIAAVRVCQYCHDCITFFQESMFLFIRKARPFSLIQSFSGFALLHGDTSDRDCPCPFPEFPA